MARGRSAGSIETITASPNLAGRRPTAGRSARRAVAAHPDGSIWFVETRGNALGRIDAQGRISEFPVNTPNASLRGVAVAPDGDLWFTENLANKIGRMAPNGRIIGEYTIPAAGCGARAITALADGRLFFSAHDIGAIGEVIPRR